MNLSEITIKVTEMDLFNDIIDYLSDLNKKHPEIGISEAIQAISEKHRVRFTTTEEP